MTDRQRDSHSKSLHYYSKTCVKPPLYNRPKIGFQYQLSLNAGQKYCRMLPLEYSAILSTFIKLNFVIKTSVLSFLKAVLHRFYCIHLTMSATLLAVNFVAC